MAEEKKRNPGKFARGKGQRGERAVVALLQPVVTLVYTEAGYPVDQIPRLERNLMQSNQGGFDIIGISWLALEVKNCEQTNIPIWWVQTTLNAKYNQEPVLFYKKNNVRWRVVMLGYLPCLERKIKCPVDITVESFLLYFKTRLSQEV